MEGMEETNVVKAEKGMLDVLIGALAILILAVASALFVWKQTGLSICTVQGVSMEPTISQGTRLLLYPEKDVSRFDIVVFRDPQGRYVIKRMVGLPGDMVTVLDGTLFINGEHYEEPYLDDAHTRLFRCYDFKAVVPEGQYFALGDNRDESLDSRAAGMISKDQLVGVAIFALD